MKQIRQFTNGIYTGISYTYTFCTASVKRRFVVDGDYRDLKGHAPDDNLWHFGNAGEVALAQFLLPAAMHRLDQGAMELFVVGSDLQIELSGDALTIVTAYGHRTEIPYADLQNVTIDRGEATIRQEGATSGFLGFGATGSAAPIKRPLSRR